MRLWSGAALLLALGCGATSRSPTADGEDTPPSAAGGMNGMGGESGVGGASDPAKNGCELPEARFVRLTFPQLVAALGDAFGEALASSVSTALGLDPSREWFLAHASPGEGLVMNDATFSQTDALAQRAGRYVAEHFELTGCATDDFGCVSDYVADLADSAFRRRVSPEQLDALLLTVERARALGVSAAVAAEFGVYAVFSSPHTLYRTELGTPGASGRERPLSDDELASSLAYHLTARGPDAELREVAARGLLGTDDGIRTQLARLLQIPSVRSHLEQSLARYLRVGQLPELVVDGELYPEDSLELRSAMRREVDELLASTLWREPVPALLTTRRATVNAGLASLYGVAFPPPGSSVDASGFAALELPETRAGFLTRGAFLLTTSRVGQPSLFTRGIVIARDLLCEPMPAPPEVIEGDGGDPMVNRSERDEAMYRINTAPCRECHANIDPFGVALGELDSFGRIRTVDELGHPIDAHIELPPFSGGATVDGAVELSRALPGDRFASCLGERYLARALALSTFADGPCQREALNRRLEQGGELTFTRVLEEVALSPAFRLRQR